MQDVFFTSKQAAQIAGCTLRQLQYWREKEVVIPTITSTGTGRSVYYSRSEVMELAVMQYCLTDKFLPSRVFTDKYEPRQPRFCTLDFWS